MCRGRTRRSTGEPAPAQTSATGGAAHQGWGAKRVRIGARVEEAADPMPHSALPCEGFWRRRSGLRRPGPATARMQSSSSSLQLKPPPALPPPSLHTSSVESTKQPETNLARSLPFLPVPPPPPPYPQCLPPPTRTARSVATSRPVTAVWASTDPTPVGAVTPVASTTTVP